MKKIGVAKCISALCVLFIVLCSAVHAGVFAEGTITAISRTGKTVNIEIDGNDYILKSNVQLMKIVHNKAKDSWDMKPVSRKMLENGIRVIYKVDGNYISDLHIQ